MRSAMAGVRASSAHPLVTGHCAHAIPVNHPPVLRLVASLLFTAHAAALAAVDHDAAMRLVATMPETLALGREVAERSNDGVRAIVMDDGEGPECWYVAVCERRSQRLIRLLTVRVGRDGAVAVWDEAASVYVALATWRQRQPPR